MNETTPRLEWLKIPIADAQAWTSGLLDFEAGWFWKLLYSSAASEIQGYLVNSSNLWLIAGAKRSDYWERHKSGVLARFKSREVDGIEMLYFPRLLEIINDQKAQLRKYRARTHSLTPVVDPKSQNQKSECVEEPRAKKEAANNAGETRRPTPLDRLIGS
jgi:hypothetical protein